MCPRERDMIFLQRPISSGKHCQYIVRKSAAASNQFLVQPYFILREFFETFVLRRCCRLRISPWSTSREDQRVAASLTGGRAYISWAAPRKLRPQTKDFYCQLWTKTSQWVSKAPDDSVLSNRFRVHIAQVFKLDAQTRYQGCYNSELYLS